jgi:hypothetical protein
MGNIGAENNIVASSDFDSGLGQRIAGRMLNSRSSGTDRFVFDERCGQAASFRVRGAGYPRTGGQG